MSYQHRAEYEGHLEGHIGTSEHYVEIGDRRGREVILSWPDAIRDARTILLAADARGLLPPDQ